MKKLLIFTLLILLSAQPVLATHAPDNIEEAEGLLYKIVRGIPGGLKSAWGEAVNIFYKLWNWIKSKFGFIGEGAWEILGREVEKKKPVIKEEFQKELDEMKEDVPKTTKSLWERLKDLIR